MNVWRTLVDDLVEKHGAWVRVTAIPPDAERRRDKAAIACDGVPHALVPHRPLERLVEACWQAGQDELLCTEVRSRLEHPGRVGAKVARAVHMAMAVPERRDRLTLGVLELIRDLRDRHNLAAAIVLFVEALDEDNR